MPISNGSFETPGSTPGTAAGWTSSYVATEEAFGEFGRNPSEAGTLGYEGFEVGWTGGDDQVFLPALGDETVGLEAGVFNLGPGQKPYEDFDTGWGDPPFPQLELLSVDMPDAETFETGWGDVALTLEAPTMGTLETFETGWVTPFTNTLSASMAPIESFEAVEAPIEVIGFATSNILEPMSSPSTPFVEDEAVQLASTGTLPAPLSPGVTYYLTEVLPAEFKLAPFPGGPAIDLTDSGEGVHTLMRDPAAWWSLLLTE